MTPLQTVRQFTDKALTISAGKYSTLLAFVCAAEQSGYWSGRKRLEFRGRVRVRARVWLGARA